MTYLVPSQIPDYVLRIQEKLKVCWPEEQVLIRSAGGAASVRLAAHQAYEGLIRSNSNTTSSMEVWGLIAAEEQELAKNLCTREWSHLPGTMPCRWSAKGPRRRVKPRKLNLTRS